MASRVRAALQRELPVDRHSKLPEEAEMQAVPYDGSTELKEVKVDGQTDGPSATAPSAPHP